MAYRGAIFNKKGGTMLHLIKQIKGKLNAKSQGPYEKVICLLRNFRDIQILWLIEALNAIKRDPRGFISSKEDNMQRRA